MDVDDLARSLGIPDWAVARILGDGRGASMLAEIWTSALYAVQICKNVCQKGNDGVVKHKSPFFPDIPVSVKCIGKTSWSIAPSYTKGKGRKCTRADVEYAIDNIGVLVTVDVRDFPDIRFIPSSQPKLLEVLAAGLIPDNGTMKREKFYEHFIPESKGDVNSPSIEWVSIDIDAIRKLSDTLQVTD